MYDVLTYHESVFQLLRWHGQCANCFNPFVFQNDYCTICESKKILSLDIDFFQDSLFRIGNNYSAIYLKLWEMQLNLDYCLSDTLNNETIYKRRYYKYSNSQYYNKDYVKEFKKRFRTFPQSQYPSLEFSSIRI